MVPANICVAVLAVAGFVQAMPSRWSTTTTTTTTTTTGMSPVIETEGPIVSQCRCCGMHDCMNDISERYFPILQSGDFRQLALDIDIICQREMPKAEECLNGFTHRDCRRLMPPTFTMFQRFCSIRSALVRGLPCWSGGFQEGMRRCLQDFASSRWTDLDTACQTVEALKSCAEDMMLPIPQCTLAERNLVEGYLRNNTLPLCPYQ